jgi:ATP-dependent Lhr-like helicase
MADKRVGRIDSKWITAERLTQVRTIYPDPPLEPPLTVPASSHSREWERADALRELVRGRLEISGPVTIPDLTRFFQVPNSEIEAALVALEGEGFVLRGRFRAATPDLEWCDRRLLARIHRLTINRLRAEIQPVSLAEYQRFLLAWQRVDPAHRAEGPEGLAAVLRMLDGYQLPAGAWEPEVFALRVKDYQPEWLDRLCYSGRAGWGRLAQPQNQNGRMSGPIRSSPIAVFARENLGFWLALSPVGSPPQFSPDTSQVLEVLSRNGAMFFGELLAKLPGVLPSKIEQALSELAAHGFVTSDSFEGLRALLLPQDKRLSLSVSGRPSRYKAVSSVEFAGRWSLLRERPASQAGLDLLDALHRPYGNSTGDEFRNRAVEAFARALLRRYGIVFRRLLEREALDVSWFELGRVYRRLESRGEIRGGYFVSGVSGEQFALPEAIGQLRTIRKQAAQDHWVTLSGADPLNLAGILTPGPRVSAVASNRLLLCDGAPLATLEAGQILNLGTHTQEQERLIERALRVGTMSAPLRRYYS